jgi:transcriptional regulator with XRE-family HTH domain
MASTFATKIQGLCKAKGLSPSDLSRLAKLDKSTISGYWQGSEPTFSKIKALAGALDVRAGYFFEEIPQLDHLTFEEVAAFESLRFLLRKYDLPEDHRYRRLLADPKTSPKTLTEWETFHSRVIIISGPTE